MGHAIASYHRTGKAGRLQVFSPVLEDDEIPVPWLFRTFEQMPALEQRALNMARGRVLDVGAGAGCHSLTLQQRGLDVTAIDLSPLAVATMRERGVKQALQHDFFNFQGRFDTILMLMNGIGIVGTLNRLPAFFRHIDELLAPQGQVLCDSSDIAYLFEDEAGKPFLPDDSSYYGEMQFQMKCDEVTGAPFNWLYIDPDTLQRAAHENGFSATIVGQGDHFDYLASITRLSQAP
ncbi:MAG: class I SAM-dependent methyltransferase [Muribaculaceae bacterium]|nr:class I SAM-dependent methyltransferase [Muribaculaceae bacterium]